MQTTLLERPTASYTGGAHAYPASSPTEGGGRPVPRRTARPILVVDDDATIRTLVVETLTDDGYPVVEAADGAAGLALAASAEPCLILLDMRMPVMDGWAFAREYRTQVPVRAPVIVMTAARDARVWAEQIGADGVLPKPFDLSELAAIVARFC